MQEKHLFEYAVIRVVPRVEREEFMNVGVILYCAGQNFLQVLSELNEERLGMFASQTDPDEIREYLRSFERICKGRKEGGAIGALPLSSRFRWLTATRSTVVQSSKVHSGFCSDPAQKILALFDQQVG
ncbi:DUF3037 domain-containing protein [Dyadobacter sp. CY323]|uniref:DUF3037 domain-containing protein n=1 Tax=Dyadobacter sp. CY323 TaxID=2907302 RepID=UPI001F22DADF|nr:DUF3037 domain-containing protein [Dyadobacter sp. CY323]MCE6987618.1 DUF3037 domain-containing protein [Dyadobacter sp. CY323]